MTVTFDKGSVTKLDKGVLEILKKALEGSGVSVELGGGTYRDLEYKMRLVFTSESDDGMTVEEKYFLEDGCWYHGLDSEMLGKTINYEMSSGKKTKFKITGFYPSRKRHKVGILNLKTKKLWFAPPAYIKEAYYKMYPKTDKELVNA